MVRWQSPPTGFPMSKYKPYPKYKESGVPEHWENHRIDWISTIIRGNTGFKKDELLDDGEYVALQYGKTYKVDEVNETFKFYVNSEFYKFSQVVHCGDTILISTSETVEDLGHSCFYNRSDLGLIGGEQILLKPNPKFVFEKYLYYASKVFSNNLKKYATGSKVFRFNIDHLKNIFISIAPLQEQKNIIFFLDQKIQKIDTLIEKQQTLIKLLKEKRQAVISHAVTKGLDDAVEMKDSGVAWLGDVPEHWIVSVAKFVSKIFVPQRNKPELNDIEGIYWVTMENMKEDYIHSSKTFVSKTAASKSGSRVLKKGAILASCVGNFGVASINKVDIIINQQLQAFIPNKINIEYLRYMVLISKNYFEMIGTASTLIYVNKEGFENLPITLPPLKEQKNIAQYLDQKTKQIDTLISKSTQAIELLKERRTALISAVVTGKIDIQNT